MISGAKRIVSLIIHSVVFLHLLFLMGIVVLSQFKMILSCQEIQTRLLKNCRKVLDIGYHISSL